MTYTKLDAAMHEAAHVVVGVGLGLRLRRAAVRPGNTVWTAEGYAWFHRTGDRLAHAIMYAAGLAWDRECARGGEWLERPHETPDEELCRQWLPAGSGEREFRTAVRLAAGMLRGLAAPHARVARALYDRDIGPREIAALARGERLP